MGGVGLGSEERACVCECEGVCVCVCVCECEGVRVCERRGLRGGGVATYGGGGGHHARARQQLALGLLKHGAKLAQDRWAALLPVQGGGLPVGQRGPLLGVCVLW